MAGIDEMINMIDQQQKRTSEAIISAAEKKAAAITAEGREKAEKAYADHMKKAQEQAQRELENSCSSADAEMKRRILACKVECVDRVIEDTVKKLHDLPEKEYFALVEKLAERSLREGEGVISLCRRDLDRLPEDFAEKLSQAAAKKNGTVKLDAEPAQIEDGFILSYGLISENCSFRAITEAEREGVRDTAARVLFGQVS
ncbi:MAG: V-type ATP synthase subunit E [Ruminococcus sp.]|nr:V-type ATP synthase subunit E [Ruminococcus sp.]